MTYQFHLTIYSVLYAKSMITGQCVSIKKYN